MHLGYFVKMTGQHLSGRSLLVRASRMYTQVTSPLAFLGRRFITHAGNLTGRKHINCLDVGAGTAPYRACVQTQLGVKNYVCLDPAPRSEDAIKGRADSIPFADSSFDLVVCFDTVQHLSSFDASLKEMLRVLKDDGHLLITFPFYYPECDVHDYRRWTMDGMAIELREHGAEVVLAHRRGGLFFALSCSINWMLQHVVPGQRKTWRAELKLSEFIKSLVVLIITLPAMILSWLALLLDVTFGSRSLYMGGSILARKTPR
jgi:SAM-dependent methyltransferase